MKHSAGFSLVSFLLALSISSILLSISTSAVTQAIQSSKMVKSATDEQLRIEHVKGVLSLLIRELDYHRLNIPPEIFSAQVFWSDGSNAQIPKKYNTDAISSFTLDTSSTLVRKEFETNNLFFCPKFSSKQEQYDFFIGVGPDGLGAFKTNSLVSVQRCQNLSLFPTRTLSRTFKEFNPKRIKILIPIKREYLLYINTENEFRYLGIKKGLIVENQPLERDISEIKFSLTQFQSLPLFILDAEIKSKSIMIRSPFSHALGRVPYSSYLLNIS